MCDPAESDQLHCHYFYAPLCSIRYVLLQNIPWAGELRCQHAVSRHLPALGHHDPTLLALHGGLWAPFYSHCPGSGQGVWGGGVVSTCSLSAKGASQAEGAARGEPLYIPHPQWTHTPPTQAQRKEQEPWRPQKVSSESASNPGLIPGTKGFPGIRRWPGDFP